MMICALTLPMAGCADLNLLGNTRDDVRRPVLRPTEEATIPEDATQVDEFDTASDADRADALEAPAEAGQDGLLGTVVASLGDPTEQGFWLKTALVDEVTTGRVVYGATGISVRVELRPLGAAEGGAQISLSAMRLLGASLTDLPELMVYIVTE